MKTALSPSNFRRQTDDSRIVFPLMFVPNGSSLPETPAAQGFSQDTAVLDADGRVKYPGADGWYSKIFPVVTEAPSPSSIASDLFDFVGDNNNLVITSVYYGLDGSGFELGIVIESGKYTAPDVTVDGKVVTITAGDNRRLAFTADFGGVTGTVNDYLEYSEELGYWENSDSSIILHAIEDSHGVYYWSLSDVDGQFLVNKVTDNPMDEDWSTATANGLAISVPVLSASNPTANDIIEALNASGANLTHFTLENEVGSDGTGTVEEASSILSNVSDGDLCTSPIYINSVDDVAYIITEIGPRGHIHAYKTIALT